MPGRVCLQSFGCLFWNASSRQAGIRAVGKCYCQLNLRVSGLGLKAISNLCD
jgi:hypothetical protein